MHIANSSHPVAKNPPPPQNLVSFPNPLALGVQFLIPNWALPTTLKQLFTEKNSYTYNGMTFGKQNTSHVCQFHAQNDPCYLLEIESKMFEITGCVGVLKLINVSPILDRFLPVTLLTLPLYGLHPRRHEWPQCLTGFQKFRGILLRSTYVTSMKNMNESKLIHQKYWK